MTSVKATLLTADGRPDVTRRFLADPDVISCYSGLMAKISQVFPGLTPDNFAIYWRDCDGDLITISSDEEASFAMIAQERNHTINFVIKDSGSAGLLHPGVVCDGCNGAIYGRRFKCAVCPDYDLCAACDEKGAHSGHPMVRIATPRQRCFANQGSRFCRMGAPPRSCPRFGAFGAPTVLAGPYVMAPGHPCFQNFDQMAKTIIENWSEAMQPKPKPQTAGEDKKPEGETDGPRLDEGFDAHAFSAMMEEVSENFPDVLNSLGGKRKAGDEEQQTQEGPTEKQGRQAEGEDKANPGAFDFEKLAEAMKPIVDNFMGVLTGEGQKASAGDKNDTEEGKTAGNDQDTTGKEIPPRDGAEGANYGNENKKTDNQRREEPHFEQAFQPWMNVLQNFFSGSQTSHAGAPGAEGASQHGAASPSASGGANFVPPQNVHEMMSSLINQFGIGPNAPCTSPSAHSFGQSQRCPTRDGRVDGSDLGTANDGHATKPSSPPKKFNFVNADKQDKSQSAAQTPSDSSCDESRLARSLAQLKSMGFSDDGGWLTTLLREKQGDVGRVIDVILPPRM